MFQYALETIKTMEEPSTPGLSTIQIEYFYDRDGQITEQHFPSLGYRTHYVYSGDKIDYGINESENGDQDTFYHHYSEDTDTLYILNSFKIPQLTILLDEEGRHIETKYDAPYIMSTTISYVDGTRIEESHEPVYGGKMIEVYDEEYDHIIRKEVDIFTEEQNENGNMIFETQIMEWTYDITFDDLGNWTKIVKLYEGESVEIKTRKLIYW